MNEIQTLPVRHKWSNREELSLFVCFNNSIVIIHRAITKEGGMIFTGKENGKILKGEMTAVQDSEE